MRRVLREAATTPPKLHEWLESIIAELSPEERSRVQEAATVAERFGARAAWRFLGEELGEEQLDKLQYNWKRFKRQLQQKDILPKLPTPAPTTSQAAVEELSPLQQALDTTLEELDGDLLGTLIDSHPRSKEPLRIPKEIPITVESTEEIAFKRALETSPKTMGALVSAFATELGLVDIQERSEVSTLFQTVDNLLVTLSDRDDKKAKDHLARLCSRTRGQIYTGVIQPDLSLIRNALLHHWTYLTAAGEDDKLLSDIEETLQDLETLLEERSEEEPAGLVSPVDMPEELLISDSPIHPVFLADVERVLEEATQGRSMDIASYTNALRQAGWDYADAETMLLLHNVQPQSLRDLLNAVYTEDMQEQNPSEAARIAQDLQNRVNNVGAQILDKGLATIQEDISDTDDHLLDSDMRIIGTPEVTEEEITNFASEIVSSYSKVVDALQAEYEGNMSAVSEVIKAKQSPDVVNAWDFFPMEDPSLDNVSDWLVGERFTVEEAYTLISGLINVLQDLGVEDNSLNEFAAELDNMFTSPLTETSEELALLVSEDIAEAYELLPREILQENPSAIKDLLPIYTDSTVIAAWDYFPADNVTVTTVRKWLEDNSLSSD